MTAKRQKSAVSNSVVAIPSVVTVRRQFLDGGKPIGPEFLHEEDVQVCRFVTEPAKVSVSMGLTLNLGNYESARVDVSLVLPCYKEEAEDAYEFAHQWVETKVLAESASIRANKHSSF